MRSAISLALAGLLTLSAGLARAGDTHYQSILAGERATGMGGAYTALADDPSATYYNPAGLVNAKNSTLSASLSVYGFQQGAIQQALAPPSGSSFAGSLEHGVTAAFSQLTTIPGLAGSVTGIGKKDDHGRFKQAWGLSVMVLDDDENTFNQNARGPNVLQDLSQTVIDQTTWIGLGYAYRPTDALSVGLSLDAIYRTSSRQARTLNGSALSASGVAGDFFLDETSLQFAVAGLFAEGGVLWAASPDFSFGLSLASPSVTVFGSGTTDEIQSYATASGPGLTDTPISGLGANTLIPVHGRLGGVYRYGNGTIFTADLSLWGPTGYSVVNGPLAAGVQYPNFVRDVTRRPVVNLDLGGQWLLFQKYPIRGGLFTNRSSAPPIDSGPEPQLTDIDLYGLTFGFTFPSQHTETTLGFVYSYGAGEGKVPSGSASTSGIAYLPTPTSESFLDIYLGGSYDF